jgi:hypothetical protein
VGRDRRSDHPTGRGGRRWQRCRLHAEKYDLGTVGNTIAGVVGGGVGAQIIGQFLAGGADVTGGESLDIGSIIGQIASGGVGGGVLMVIVGLIKQAMGGQKPA